MTNETKVALALSACFLLLGCDSEEWTGVAEPGMHIQTYGSYDSADQPLITPDTDVTIVHLSAAEARRFEEQSGGMDAGEGLAAGGTLVLAGTMDDPIIQELLDTYDAELVEESRRTSSFERELELSSPAPQSLCNALYLKNIKFEKQVWFSDQPPLDSVVGSHRMTLMMDINTSVSASFSADVGVNASVVSAGVKYDVTGTYGISKSVSWPVPPGKKGKLEAFALYDKHTWEVWDDPCLDGPHKVGTGKSYRPSGVYFRESFVK